MVTSDDERISREAEQHIRWDGLIEAIVTTALFIIFSIVFGYLSWINYLNFYGSTHVLNWDVFDWMVTNIFLSGLCVGICFMVIQMLLRKEIKKELERRKERKSNGKTEKTNQNAL